MGIYLDPKDDYKKTGNSSNDKSSVTQAIVSLLVATVFVIWLSSPLGSSKKETPPPKTQTQTVQNYSIVTNEQIQEMRTAYNQVLTDTLKPICVGTAIRNESWVNVYVNSLWYELNKGQKTEFINRCKNTYAGMLGARGIKVNYNSVIIFINLTGSEKHVGKWSGVSGVIINE